MSDKTEWRPIETAPKDGTLVLVAGGRLSWSARPDMDSIKFSSVAIAGVNARGEWQGDTGADGEYAIHVPTHWMPLPEPPK